MKNITLSLIYNSFEMVADWWNYQNVISPFNRIYFITEGEGWVQFNNTNYHLTPGKLFLIPKFTFHNYRCNDKMGHYYICFFDELAFGENIHDCFGFQHLVDAITGDELLFRRINEINPSGKIHNPDPAIYDNDKTLYSFTSHRHLIKTSGIIEIQGIIYQLVSRFISDCQSPHSNTQKKRLSKITHYVQQNLHKKLALKDLAELVCLSPDYFSSLFLEVMGIRPMEYVNRIRIERAQLLLLTTDLTVTQIAENVGIASNSYFTTLFKKQTLTTPELYKQLHNKL